MDIEYEATFENIDKDKIRKKLKEIGAELVKGEFLMKKSIFYLPKNNHLNGEWLRVRDEGDKFTLSLKKIGGGKIEDQKEICLEIDDAAKTEALLQEIGCKRRAYQESKREIWKMDAVEICIDEWPFLEPFVEVEGNSEKEVRIVAEKLGFKWENAIFESVDYQYHKKYGVSRNEVCDKTPLLTFDKNPFQDITLK